MVKNVPAIWETQVQSLGWEDPMEKGMTTHSTELLTILAWRTLNRGAWWAILHGVAKTQTGLSN